MSRSHEVKMYPIEPCRDGNALIEYDVLNSELGDLEIANFSPEGTSKSNIATSHMLVRIRSRMLITHH